MQLKLINDLGSAANIVERTQFLVYLWYAFQLIGRELNIISAFELLISMPRRIENIV